MKLGSLQIDSIIDGECVTPANASYPDVPEEEWKKYERFLLPDGSTQFSIGAYLIRGLGDRVVLVDAGTGPKSTFPFAGGGLRTSLLSLGVTPADITDVLFTHLHSDHIGWATQDGVPFFPNATYRCDKRDWDFFMADDYDMPEWEQMFTNPVEDAASVRLAPVADRMEFWEGDDDVLPGITSMEASGHTPGTSVLIVESDGERAAFIGDVVHNQAELIRGWGFGAHVDLEAGTHSTITIRNYLADEGIPVAGAHFLGLRWGKVVRDGDDYDWVDLPDQ